MGRNARFSGMSEGVYKIATAQVEVVATPDSLANRFRQLGISATTYAHPPVFTVEEGQDFKCQIPGGHTKNLFLKDKKGRCWLVTALQDTVIDLKWLPQRINAARLSFGNPDLLKEMLGVTPGSVTALALVNDTQKKVCPVLDRRLFDCKTVNCHPLTNEMTTNISPQDLLIFMKSLGFDPLIVDFAR